jgi:hypothetical protein
MGKTPLFPLTPDLCGGRLDWLFAVRLQPQRKIRARRRIFAPAGFSGQSQ